MKIGVATKRGVIKQVILVRKDLKMGPGKVAAQASHASLLSYLETARSHPDIRLKTAKIPFKAVKDAGYTQVPPGTETAIGIGPYYSKEIDKITGDLPLF